MAEFVIDGIRYVPVHAAAGLRELRDALIRSYMGEDHKPTEADGREIGVLVDDIDSWAANFPNEDQLPSIDDFLAALAVGARGDP